MVKLLRYIVVVFTVLTLAALFYKTIVQEDFDVFSEEPAEGAALEIIP